MNIFLTKNKIWLLILFSFFAALALTFLHLPGWVEWVCPQWLVVMVLYWTFAMPYRVNVGVAWMVGFLLDILYNTPVGENALALVTASYFIIIFGRKIRLLHFWKKALVIFSLIMWCQLLPLLMQIFLGRDFIFWPIFGRAIISALIWLLIEQWFNYKKRAYFESYH